MKNWKFVEYIGNASTNGSYNGHRIGYNVSVVTNEKDGVYMCRVESSGVVVAECGAKFFDSIENYENFKDSLRKPKFIGALEEFGVRTAWSDSLRMEQTDEEWYQEMMFGRH